MFSLASANVYVPRREMAAGNNPGGFGVAGGGPVPKASVLVLMQPKVTFFKN
jgi:hypothetical protein